MVVLVDTNDMIVAERKEEAVIDKFDRFGEAMPDGRLTMPSEGKYID